MINITINFARHIVNMGTKYEVRKAPLRKN